LQARASLLLRNHLGFRKVIVIVLGARSGSARYSDVQKIVGWLTKKVELKEQSKSSHD
jgi:D-alanyl-D-alanine carboxypeptidase